MPKTRLDQKLLGKLTKKLRKSSQYIREQISRRASRQGISSEAAQILWARELGIGAGTFLRSLPPHVQDQVRTAVPTVFPGAVAAAQKGKAPKTTARRAEPDIVRAAVGFLVEDEELKKRCTDLLTARGHYDRVFREATTVLEDRLKRLAGIKGKVNPEEVAAKVVNPNPDQAILKVSDDPGVQRGYFSICHGIFLAFRNPTHHRLTERFTQQEALQFCGFVDAMLRILSQAQKNPQGA